ncbi:MAG: hypothetical protein K5683_03215 [Prevotella sp.]|nr:hypothetical protein [Prevotella sp.]
MKKLNLFLYTVFAVVGIMLTGCSSDDSDEKSETGKSKIGIDLDNVKVEMGEVKTLTIEEMAEKIYGPREVSSESVEEFRKAVLRNADRYEQKVESQYGSNGSEPSYRYCNFNYWSVDAFGEPVMLSGCVAWSTITILSQTTDLKPERVALAPHYTILSNSQAPSESLSMEMAALVGECLVILPDYMGYGVSKNMVHPYLNHDLCAQNCVDALDAGYKTFKEMSNADLDDSWKLYVTGCSQGGANALAIQKWMEMHPDFAERWRYQYSYCGSGPYSPSVTMKCYLQTNYQSYPCTIPMVLNSMRYSYPDILGQFSEEEFYSDKYLAKKAEFDEMLAEKEAESDDVNDLFFKYFPCDKRKHVKLSDILNPRLFDPSSDLSKALFACLEKNDLTKGWTPTHQIKLYHSKGDEVVPYENATAVVEAFGTDKVDLATATFKLGHLASCFMFLTTLTSDLW